MPPTDTADTLSTAPTPEANATPRLSLRAAILQKDDFEPLNVAVPEWCDRPLRVKALTGAERDAYEQKVSDERDDEGRIDFQGFKALLVCITLEDPQTGELIFTPGDAKILNEKSAKVVDRLFQIAKKVNGFSDADVAAFEGN